MVFLSIVIGVLLTLAALAIIWAVATEPDQGAARVRSAQQQITEVSRRAQQAIIAEALRRAAQKRPRPRP